MIDVERDAIVFTDPEVHPEAKCTIVFQRTLRVPQDKGRYPVPPGLGRFEISSLRNSSGKMPRGWNEAGFFFPLFQSEAFWVIFIGWYPYAVKVAVGDVNAITGKRIHDERLWRPRDFTVVPRRPWMEWFSVGNGTARQFVPLPLGRRRNGAGRESAAEIRLTACPMKAERYRDYRKGRAALMTSVSLIAAGGVGIPSGCPGHREQDGDQYGPGAWAVGSISRCHVYPLNSLDFLDITGRTPPGRGPTRAEYTEAGLPWLDHYGADDKVLARCRHRAS